MAVATATETVDPPESRPPNDEVSEATMFARTSGPMPCREHRAWQLRPIQGDRVTI
jgi:hypothetical protein